MSEKMQHKNYFRPKVLQSLSNGAHEYAAGVENDGGPLQMCIPGGAPHSMIVAGMSHLTS